MGKISFLVLVSLLVFASLPVWGSTWYVDDSVAASGDGKSWETAFKKIQEGIDAASDGDTVIVAEGTYVGNIRFKGENIILTSTDPLSSSVVANTIIESAVGGIVVFFSGDESEACVLSGFTVRSGSGYDCTGIYGLGSHATIENNVVTGNTVSGLVYCDGVIQNNMVAHNSAAEQTGCGGGLSACGGVIKNNVIIYNSAGRRGGGLCHCDGTVENNTIVRNSAGFWDEHSAGAGHGGGLDGCQGTIRNCIIWGNTAWYDEQMRDSSLPTYSCIQGWEGAGTGNISGYPHFVDARAGDYRLRSWSPCVDAGDPSSDFSNEPEPNGGRIDMGAYGNTPQAPSESPDTDNDGLPDTWEQEFFGTLTHGASDDPDGDGRLTLEEYRQGANPAWWGWYVDGSAAGSGDGTSWQTPFKTIQEGIDAASECDIVVVAQGTYHENVRFNGTNIILRGADPLDPGVVAKTAIAAAVKGSSCVTFSGFEDETCVLSGFTIRNGSASLGGGICGSLIYPTHATIEFNTITGNSAPVGSGQGGGIAFCRGPINNNIICGNSALTWGGGLAWCYGTIQNNTICGNSALTLGGGLAECRGLIENNTITGNSAQYGGGGLYYCNGTIRNCIVWGNTAPADAQLPYSPSPSNCCIQAWTGGGTGNTNRDPRFVDLDGPDDNPNTWEDNNYRLQSDSPCIDAGWNEGWMWGAIDLDGNPRIWRGRASLTVDMGAYEYGSFPFKVLGITEAAAGEAQLTWISRPGDAYTVWSCADLSTGEWVEEASVASQGQSTSWTDVSAVGQQKFYRIELK
jgi:hypothetical protein